MADAAVGRSVVESLRRAREPVRESALYERVREQHAGLTPQAFLAALERLGTEGLLHVAVEHDRRADDPPPFQPRYWRVVE